MITSCSAFASFFLGHLRTQLYCGGFPSPSAGTTTPFSSSILANEPSWCIVMRISQPPMNSLSTYSCGIVGHSEYSLIPVYICQRALITHHFKQRAGNVPHGAESKKQLFQRTSSQFLIFQHIEGCELLWVYTLHAQNLYASS